ncbi:hypothetical protein C4580_00230 [Candidatus Woesearchaeota archaeon]|nr:MAG: hypothetical protein C4580_00230 [Candidatus Woesearchaeota archaeon]
MKKGLKCVCGKEAKPKANLRFNGFKIAGWVCASCGERYYEPAQAQRILLLNKLMKERFRLTLSQVRSNLVLRIPKEVGVALKLKKGGQVELGVRKGKEIVVQTAED